MLFRIFCFAVLLSIVPGIGVAQKRPAAQKQKPAPVIYSCPMHPDVTSTKPGSCPKCGMTMRPVKQVQPAQKENESAPATEATNENPSFSSLKIPNSLVYDQNGKELDFYTDLIKGKTVAINFIFTTCTASCPPLTATFRKVQQDTAQRGLDVKLISISVDPTVDTPERLLAFAQKYNAEPGWTFVTGSKTEIDSLLKGLGVAITNKNDHTPMIMIGNDVADYWTRAYGLSAPTKLVDLIADAAGRK